MITGLVAEVKMINLLKFIRTFTDEELGEDVRMHIVHSYHGNQQFTNDTAYYYSFGEDFMHFYIDNPCKDRPEGFEENCKYEIAIYEQMKSLDIEDYFADEDIGKILFDVSW